MDSLKKIIFLIILVFYFYFKVLVNLCKVLFLGLVDIVKVYFKYSVSERKWKYLVVFISLRIIRINLRGYLVYVLRRLSIIRDIIL